jgi:cytochrome c
MSMNEPQPLALRILVSSCIALIATAARGQTAEPPKTWAACAACHAAGIGSIGPTLNGVVGRKAASVPGFGYSAAMKSTGITWDEASLTAFVSDPQKTVPGNRMFFAGVADPSDVAELVEYLKTLR